MDQKGIKLAELIIVVVIMGVGPVLMVPNIGLFGSTRRIRIE
jgi:competence protein ComGC